MDVSFGSDQLEGEVDGLGWIGLAYALLDFFTEFDVVAAWRAQSRCCEKLVELHVVERHPSLMN